MDTDEELVDELDLSVLRSVGAPSREVHVEYERDLGEADMAALELPRGVRPRSLVRIHSSHHALARCIAAGMKPSQAALVTGYQPARISTLQSDPAFIALVADYKTEVKGVFADLAERMNNLSLDAIGILMERLHDTPEAFDPGTLLDMIKVFADRTGHGPNQEVHLRVDTEAIDRPARETYEEWQRRRAAELDCSELDCGEVKKLN